MPRTPGREARLPFLVVIAGLLTSVSPRATHAQAPVDVPPSLREWVPWVTAGEPTYGCTRVGGELVCAWPGTLELAIDGNDVRFTLSLVVDRRRSIALPGGEGQWPIDVVEGTRELAVIGSADGVPAVLLEAGVHRLDGRIRFGRRPESLRVPADVARVFALAEGGIRFPLERASEGVVPLEWAARAASPALAEEATDSLSLDVVRRISDGVPLTIETQITARIGGRARSISLGRVLVEGSVPSAVESSLPIQISPEGDVVLQAQSGTHRVRISAFVANPTAALTAPRVAPPWPEQEIWLFAPSEVHRQVDVRGASSIDPQSPSIPEDWRSAAAYVLRGGEALTLAEVRRGEPEPPPNGLVVHRELWLDFDGRGFTVRDRLSGEIHRAGRLDLLAGELGRVSVDRVDQLITIPPNGRRGARGIEVRRETLDIDAEWRLRASPSDIPAVGWTEDARELAMTLNLPPGYSLFAARGVDSADAWLSRWDVGPLFLVLLIAVIFTRLYGKRAGAAALVTMVLIYHERDAPTFLWLAVLVPTAVMLLFRKGTFARIVFVLYALATMVLLVYVGMFAAQHLRYALHPQLYTEDVVGGQFQQQSPFGGDFAAAPEPAAEMMEGGSAVAPALDEMTRNARGSGSVSRSPSDGDADGRANRYAAVENWIDPNAVVQTGHGLVDWRHTAISLAWSGPVARDHRVHLYLVPPWLQRVLAFARAAGLIFLVYTLFRKRPLWPSAAGAATAGGAPPAGPSDSSEVTEKDATLPGSGTRDVVATDTAPVPVEQEPSTERAEPGVVPRLVLAGLALVFSLGANRAHAQAPTPIDAVAPSPTILGDLHDRLLAPPSCGDRCARIGDASLEVDGDRLRILFVAHAEVLSAIPLPGPSSSFVPTTVLVDGAPSNALRLGPDGHILLRLAPGVHRVELGADLVGRASIALSFADRPGRLTVRATGWTVSGVDENGLVRGSLELRRQLGATTGPTTAGGTANATARTADVPVWVSVERHVDVGVQWLVRTTIRRLSSTSAPAVVRLAALPGETVLGAEAARDGNQLVATLGQGVPELVFTSSIDTASSITLQLDGRATAANDVHRSETWSFACSPLWHCTHDGIAPIRHAVESSFQPTFAPYPGDRVRITTTRLRAAPGSSFTIDGATLTLTPGARSREGDLVLEVRTSVSNTLRLGFPSGVDIERVEVDGERRAVQVRNHSLSIGIAPHNHAVTVHFRESRGLDLVTTTPRITIAGSAVDVNLVTNLPADRWVLLASGPSWGPIVLFWGHLALVLLVAVLLGRVGSSPLRTYEWALLALGLTQIPIVATMVVAAWFFVVAAQHRRLLHGLAFNLAQVAATFHAFVAACIMVAAAWVGLNERPDMQIVGNGSSSDSLRWYADRATHVLPTATFVSVSVWLWKGLMLAWAFWLAYSVVRWAVWAVSPFRDAGFFDRLKPTGLQPAPEAPRAPASPPPQ